MLFLLLLLDPFLVKVPVLDQIPDQSWTRHTVPAQNEKVGCDSSYPPLQFEDIFVSYLLVNTCTFWYNAVLFVISCPFYPIPLVLCFVLYRDTIIFVFILDFYYNRISVSIECV